MLKLGNLEFEWDDAKAHATWSKHGVSSEEAATAFHDPWGLLIPHPRHSVEEER